MSKFAKRSMSRKDVMQFLRSFVGGTIYFWAGYVVFAFCYSGLHWDWLYAKVVADIVGLSLNYLVQRYWAFNSPELKDHEARNVRRFGTVSILNLGLDYLIIAGLKAIGISPYLGFFISSAFFTIWNFLWYRFWIFLGKAKKEGIHG